MNEDQEDTKVLEGMVIEKRLPNLLSLLESHARTTVPGVLVIPKPLTLIILAPIQTEPTDKKWKRDRRRGKGVVEKGEVQEENPPEPTKVIKVTCAQQRKGVKSLIIDSERRSKVPI